MRIEPRRSWATAGYLALCLLLGGASARGAGVIGNALLQILAIFIIFGGLLSRRTPELPRGARPILLIFGAYLLFVLLSLIPLPPDVWRSLPGRQGVAYGYDLLALPSPALPLTLSWQQSLTSIMWLLPPAAVFLLVSRASPRERGRLLWLILAICAVSIVLGVAQLLGGENSALRFYQVTNRTQPVGFFSNANHFAIMLVCALPLAGYVAGRSASSRGSKAERSSSLVIAGAVALFLLCGIGTVGSIAGYGLALPSALAAFLIYRKAAYGKIGLVWGGAAALLFASFIGIAFAGPLNNERLSEEISGAPASRAYIARTTLKGIAETFPAGTGLGTFQEIYRTQDDPYRVSREYVNHAHNDYLEVVLELGVVGLLLLLAFLAWFVTRSIAAWRASFEGTGLARAGSVIVFVVLLHSVVDYPLRTSAVAGLFAFACALLVPYLKPRPSEAPATSSGEGLRHLKAD